MTIEPESRFPANGTRDNRLLSIRPSAGSGSQQSQRPHPEVLHTNKFTQAVLLSQK